MWDTPTFNGRSLAPIGQNDQGPFSTVPAKKTLTSTFWQISKILLVSEILIIKVSAKLWYILVNFYTHPSFYWFSMISLLYDKKSAFIFQTLKMKVLYIQNDHEKKLIMFYKI